MVTWYYVKNRSQILLQYRGAFYKPKCQGQNHGDGLSHGLSCWADLKARAPALRNLERPKDTPNHCDRHISVETGWKVFSNLYFQYQLCVEYEKESQLDKNCNSASD